MKLWRVYAECELLIASASEPSHYDVKRALRDGFACDGVPFTETTAKVSSRCQLDSDELRSLPFNGDGRRCAEYFK